MTAPRPAFPLYPPDDDTLAQIRWDAEGDEGDDLADREDDLGDELAEREER